MPNTNSAYQFKILIQDSKPPIWRRVLVPQKFTFHQLHLTIQSVFDWLNYHLYSFETLETKPMMKSPSMFLDRDIIIDFSIPENEELGNIDSRTEKISKYFKQVGNKMNYTYDFGDNWDHNITLEKIIDNYEFKYPQCIKAVGHAPCEDAGGIWGWEDKIDMLKNYNPKDQEQRELYEWLCETVPDIDDLENPKDFDPKFVDLESINEQLKNYEDMESELS
jgi:hypothetical protein